MFEERDVVPVSLVLDLLPKITDEMVRPFKAFYGFPTSGEVSTSFDGNIRKLKTNPDVSPALLSSLVLDKQDDHLRVVLNIVVLPLHFVDVQ